MKYQLVVFLESSLANYLFDTLEEAKDEALKFIENDGWVAEKCYIKQPENGMAWAYPDRSGIVLIIEGE